MYFYVDVSSRRDPCAATDATNEVVETIESSTRIDAAKPGLFSGKKRDSMKLWSLVWDHFAKEIDEEGYERAVCIYCNKEFCCNSKVNGTSNLKNHGALCKENPYNKDGPQA